MNQTPRPTKPSRKASKSIESKTKSPPLFTPLPHPYSKLFIMLLESGLVAKEPLRMNTPKNFSSYDRTRTCAYPMGEKGHSVDNCLILKHKVQALIDSEILKFDNLELNVQ